MAKEPMGDVVVLLPGILGSALARDGKEIWAPSPGAIGRALWTLGGSVRSLALEDDPWEQDDLGDGVVGHQGDARHPHHPGTVGDRRVHRRSPA